MGNRVLGWCSAGEVEDKVEAAARLHAFMDGYFALQEPDWSDAIADTGRGKAVGEARDGVVGAREAAAGAADALRRLRALGVGDDVLRGVVDAVDGALAGLERALDGIEAVEAFL